MKTASPEGFSLGLLTQAMRELPTQHSNAFPTLCHRINLHPQLPLGIGG